MNTFRRISVLMLGGLLAIQGTRATAAVILTYDDSTETPKLTSDDPNFGQITNTGELSIFVADFARADFPTEVQGEVAFKEADGSTSDIFQIIVKFVGDKSRLELDFLSDTKDEPLPPPRPGSKIFNPEPVGFVTLAGPNAGKSLYQDAQGNQIAFPAGLTVKVRSDVEVVPEPNTFILITTGSLCLLLYRRSVGAGHGQP